MPGSSQKQSDVSQASGLKRVLRNKENPLPFVKDLIQSGDHSVASMEQLIEQMLAETDAGMKRAVYQNYQLFIEAAKEVGLLEAEMQVMSSMLKDQRQLLESLIDFRLSDLSPASAPTDVDAAGAGDSRKALSHLLERVEGSSDVADVPNRRLLHRCACAELDQASRTPVGDFVVFVLNDCLLLAAVAEKTSLQEVIELDNVAVSGAEQPDGAAGASLFRLRVFPDTRLFSANSADEAAALVDCVRSAKLSKAVADSDSRQRAGQASVQDPDVQWFEDKPDDLDVLIAERRLDKAVDLLLECYARLEKRPELKLAKARADLRRGAVIRLLLKELQIPPHVSLRGGPKSSRKAVKELVRLGRTTEAAEHYLRLRSSIRSHLVSQVKQEDSQALFAKRISAAFFKTFAESLREFRLIGFGRETNSLLLRWCRSEVAALADRLGCVLAEGSANFAEFASGWYSAVAAARTAGSSGQVQAEFMLEDACLSVWQSAIERQSVKLTSAADARAAEEKWVVLKRASRTEAEQFLSFLRQLDPSVTEALSQSPQFDISSMTYVFSSSFLKFADSLSKLYTRELHHVIGQSLASVLLAELKHYKRCLSAAQLLDKRNFILHNLEFLHTKLLTVCNAKLEAASGIQPEQFEAFWAAQADLRDLIEAGRPSLV